MASRLKVSWLWTTSNINNILQTISNFDKPIYHICSGTSNIGDIRIDRSNLKDMNVHLNKNFVGCCNIIVDMNNIPIKSSVAGSIICDPPYYYDFINDNRLINELVRICKPKGKILFISPWVPNNKNITVLNTELWKVGKNRPYFKIRTLFYKSNGQLSDYA